MSFVEDLLRKAEPPGKKNGKGEKQPPSRFKLVAEQAYDALKKGDKEEFLEAFEAAVAIKKSE